jgi:hypothetical protein
MIPAMDSSVIWRSALVQTAGVVVLSLALALALPSSFFDDWGWLSGPGAWLACAALTAAVLKLPRGPVLLGAVLAGIPSAVAVIAGVHWAGVVIAVACFALWCGRLAARGGEGLAWT